MTKRIVIIALAAAMALPLAGCLKKKEKEDVSSSEDNSSVVSIVEQEKSETPDTHYTPDTPESPDFSQKEEYVSPFEFPYEPSDIKNVLEEYGEEKGLRFNGTLTMTDSKSVTKVETKGAVNGRVLETWCKKEIDDIITLAKNNGLTAFDIEFNIAVCESSRYDGEYDITIYSK